MIAVGALLTALTFSNARQLLEFAVQLLHLPTDVVRVLNLMRGE